MQPKLDNCPRCGSNDPDRVIDEGCEMGGRGHAPMDIPSATGIARVMELQHHMDHQQQNANRQVAVGRLLSVASRIRNRRDILSARAKEVLLSEIVAIADDFLEGR